MGNVLRCCKEGMLTCLELCTFDSHRAVRSRCHRTRSKVSLPFTADTTIPGHGTEPEQRLVATDRLDTAQGPATDTVGHRHSRVGMGKAEATMLLKAARMARMAVVDMDSRSRITGSPMRSRLHRTLARATMP